jgi:hypothetical protein
MATDYVVTPSGMLRVPTNRVFYNDDSDDSYESRVSQAISTHSERRHSSRSRSRNKNKAKSKSSKRGVEESDMDDDYDDDDDAATTGTTATNTAKTILRYRGFSTSVKSLFLDESLVCASMGCFGLILSNRTEYLLQLRNQTRGKEILKLEHVNPNNISSSSRHRKNVLHSRVVAYALVVTLFLIGCTFVIWGFGNSSRGGAWNAFRNHRASSASASNSGSDADNTDNSQQQQQQQADDNYKSDYDNYQNNLNNKNGGYDYNYRNNYNYNNYNNNNGQGNSNNKYNDDLSDNNNNNNNNSNDEQAANETEEEEDNNENVDNDNGDNDGNRARRQLVSRRRQRQHPGMRWRRRHRFLGITKLRDFSEHIWEPAVDAWNSISYNSNNNGWWYGTDESHKFAFSEDRHLQSSDGSSSSSSSTQAGKINWAADIRGVLVCLFLLFLGILGRRRRMRTRYAIAKARAQEDHLFYASTKIGEVDLKNLNGRRSSARDDRSKEDHYEGACLHTLCGCYPVDPAMDEEEEQYYIAEEEEEDLPIADGIFKTRKKRRHEDCVSRAFNCFLASCCGVMCKCWFQCLSICALAQEAREMRLLLPPRFQRIDFITHQPFHEYQKDVNDLRRGWMGKTRRKAGILPHIHALSRLSRYIVVTFSCSLVIIILTLLFNPRATFTWPDVIVLVATFVQGFLVIYIVHWIFHKSDLSLDAVIKYFAAGFVIATPAAFLFESMLWGIVTASAWLGYMIMDLIKGDEFELFLYNHYSYFWVVGELIQAYLVAAVIEELCKYYTFRSVEHPDLIFLTGLDRQAQDETAVDGGLVKYPYGSHQVSNLNRSQSCGSVSEFSRRSGSSYRRGRSRDSDDDDTFQGIHKTTTTEEFFEDENDARTFRQRAAAVTTGMISLAVGLATAENFLYVFLSAGGESSDTDDEQHRDDKILQEWMILFFRSIFPVHALGAAMQSINVIRKFVECTSDNNHRIGVGRIILPAVLMHGTFDAILMMVNVYVEVSRDKWLRKNNNNADAEGRPYNPLLVNLVAWMSVTGLMLLGLVWYYRENRNQKLRLKLLEASEEGEDDLPYTGPSAVSPARTAASEIELS